MVLRALPGMSPRELEPTTTREVLRSQRYNVILGAFGALASYALFHVVTVFPLSWIMLYSKQSVTQDLRQDYSSSEREPHGEDRPTQFQI